MIRKLFLIPFIVFFVSTAAAFSNSGGGDWEYYRIITIEEESGNTFEDYQVPVEFNKGNFPNYVNYDGSDIRFFGDGKELDVWVQEFDKNKKTGIIWVKIPKLTANGNTKVKMYYGNEKAESVSNEVTTFEFFDDFEDGIITDKWEIVEGNWTEKDGTIIQTEQIQNCALSSKDGILTDNLIVESKMRGSDIIGVATRMNGNASYWGSFADTNRKYVQISAKLSGTIKENTFASILKMDQQTWYVIHSAILGNNVEAKIFDSKMNLLNSVSSDLYYKGTGDKIGLITNSYGEWDWLRVRKYTHPEPSITFSKEYVIEKIPSLKIEKISSYSEIPIDEPITISLEVENVGNIDAESVEIIDAIPPEFRILGGSSSFYVDIIKPGEIQTIKYSIIPKEAGNITFEPAVATYKEADGNSLIDWSNSFIIKVNNKPAITPSYQISDIINADEIWIDNFSNDTSDSYHWKVSNHSESLPGGAVYEKYHHDGREYSFTKFVSEGRLHIIGDDWFNGRIYAYKAVQFDRPIQELTLNVKGSAHQGILHIQAPIGIILYESESEFLKDFNIDTEEGIDINTYDHALISTVGKGELTNVLHLKEPRKDFLLVLVAHDPWAWCDGEASKSYISFDDVRLDVTYANEKTLLPGVISSFIKNFIINFESKIEKLKN